MKNMSSMLKKLLSILCIVLMVSVVFAAAVKNVNAESEDEDTDDDGLSDWEEAATYETDWTDPDTDDDGLKDGEEVNTYNTDPNDFDTDNDRLLDGYNQTLTEDYGWRDENKCESDWTDAGIYHVGETWLGELSYGCNANDSDTDNDNMWDGWEAYYGTKPTFSDANEDYDYDNLTNTQEYKNGTHPNNPDTDSDYLNDYAELEMSIDPLTPDFDEDGVLDGLDYQPKARWDVEWEPYYIPAGEDIISTFAVLTNIYQQPEDNDVKKAIETQYKHSGVIVKDVTYIDNISMPPEIANHRYKDELEKNDLPRFEYRYTVRYSRSEATPTDYFHTVLSWTLEPNADQRISVQFSFNPKLSLTNTSVGFIVDFCEEGYRIPNSTFFASATPLENNKSYQVDIQIPWGIISNAVKNIFISLRPTLSIVNYSVNGSVENVSFEAVNIAKNIISIASVTGTIIKDPYLVAVRPDLDPETVLGSLPDNITEYHSVEYTNYTCNGYLIEEIECSSNWTGLYAPICMKAVVDPNETKPKDMVAVVIVGRLLSDVDTYRSWLLDPKGNLWYTLTHNETPLINITMGCRQALLNYKELRDRDGNSILPVGTTMMLTAVSNSTTVVVSNFTFNNTVFYEAVNSTVTAYTWQLVGLSSIQNVAEVAHTMMMIKLERGMHVERLGALQGKNAWVAGAFTGAVATVVCVITLYKVTIAIDRGEYFEAFIYTATGVVIMSGLLIEKEIMIGERTIQWSAGGKFGGASFWIAVAIMNTYFVIKAFTADDAELRDSWLLQIPTYTTVACGYLVAGKIGFILGGPIGAIVALGIMVIIDFVIPGILYLLGVTDHYEPLSSTLITGFYHAIGKKTPEEILKDRVTACITNWAERRLESGIVPVLVTQTVEGESGPVTCPAIWGYGAGGHLIV